jgi:hypothetical protein
MQLTESSETFRLRAKYFFAVRRHFRGPPGYNLWGEPSNTGTGAAGASGARFFSPLPYSMNFFISSAGNALYS